MKTVGIAQDEIIYNLVIKGFCLSVNLEMGKRVYSALHRNGHKPNEKIYQTMIHYLCVHGDYDLAYTMCKDLMKKTWFPSMDIMGALIEGLRKTGQTGKVKYDIDIGSEKGCHLFLKNSWMPSATFCKRKDAK